MKKNDNQQMIQFFKYSLLASSICMVNSNAYALQELTDQGLRQVDAQDGVSITTSYDSLNIDRLYWEDKAGTSADAETTLRGYADGVTITGTGLGSTIKIDAGSNGSSAGLDFNISSNIGTTVAQSFKVCDATGATCGASMGGVAIQSQAGYDPTIHLVTRDGLFNKNSLADLTISLRNINLYLSQIASGGIKNQLILKDFNFNFDGKGYAWISDVGGLILETRTDGYIDLARVTDPLFPTKDKPGLNIDILYKAAASGTYDLTGALGMLKLGASGRMLNASLTFRGTDARSAANNIMGFAFSGTNATTTPDSTGVNASILGSTGLALRMKADFTRGTATETTLELGHGGTNAYGIRFSNLSPLLIRAANGGGPLNTANATFDSGNIYVNLINTKRMQLPVNATLNAARLGSGTLTTNADYIHLVHNTAANPNAVGVAIRGMQFQTISRKSEFIVSNDVVTPGDIPSASGTWGIGLPIYNLNANLALYGTTVSGSERLGFGLGLSTQGRDATGSQTTSILLIDGEKYGSAADPSNPTQRLQSSSGDPINYYFGLRNIDMLITANGSMGLENGKLNITIPQLTLTAAAEVAAGYLPGSQYKTIGAGYVPINNFQSNKDVLFGLKIRMDGNMDLTLVPGTNSLTGNNLSFQGTFGLSSGSIQISDPIDNSILGLDTLSGKVAFNNYIKVNKDNVDFSVGLTFNPSNVAADVLRVKDINLYPQTGAGQRLGEMVITGGTLTSKFNIIPR